MTQHEDFPDTHHEMTHNTFFGFWIYLMTDFILFATLFASYAVLRDATFGGPGGKELFNLPAVLLETLILSTSGFTCGLATLAIPVDNKKKVIAWYAVTFLLGLWFFLQVCTEFGHLIQDGNTWQKSAFLSAYFTLVGTHALHILLGLVFIVVFLIQVTRRGLIPVTKRRLTCLSMFWFFSYVVWIFMYAIVYLMGVT